MKLVTGTSGFLGQLISPFLNDVVSLGRAKSNSIVCDLATEMPQFGDVIFDQVIHIAGKAHSLPRNDEEREEFFQVNFYGTKRLCEALSRLNQKPKSFIYISSVSVYGLESGQMIDESYPLLGETAYAKSKIITEQYLSTWAKKEQITLGILRLPLIAGPNPPGNLGMMINGIAKCRYLSIGNAVARKSVIWGEDIVQILPALSQIGGIYNLTDGHHPSFAELENVISQAIGKKKPISIPIGLGKLFGSIGDLFGPNFPITSDKLSKITATLIFNDMRAREILGWQPSDVLTKLKKMLTTHHE